MLEPELLEPKWLRLFNHVKVFVFVPATQQVEGVKYVSAVTQKLIRELPVRAVSLRAKPAKMQTTFCFVFDSRTL